MQAFGPSRSRHIPRFPPASLDQPRDVLSIDRQRHLRDLGVVRVADPKRRSVAGQPAMCFLDGRVGSILAETGGLLEVPDVRHGAGRGHSPVPPTGCDRVLDLRVRGLDVIKPDHFSFSKVWGLT